LGTTDIVKFTFICNFNDYLNPVETNHLHITAFIPFNCFLPIAEQQKGKNHGVA
jgi:hypothetical protein